MVVVGSRVEAVRWQLAMTKYIRECGYPIGVLVAFSGEVTNKDSGPDPFSENSKLLNPGLHGRDIREAFKGDEYHLLLVANKFPAGFDQPLLCGMYVDKRLAGIQAVQTLSRLNRSHPGKDTTYILDFVNEPDDVLAAFKPYHETAELCAVTDPNLVYDLRVNLDASGCHGESVLARLHFEGRLAAAGVVGHAQVVEGQADVARQALDGRGDGIAGLGFDGTDGEAA